MGIRFATSRDRVRIIEIYNQAIATGVSTAHQSPVTVASRSDWFAVHESEKYPILVEEFESGVRAWCSISPYRAGREALRFTAELSYYVAEEARRQGIATRIVEHAIALCPHLGIKTLFGILLDTNHASVVLLEKLGFERWGHLPGVADFDGRECGHLYLGKRVG